MEYGRHPTAIRDPVNKTNAAEFLSKLVDIAILITDEKEVLELCRSGKCQGDGYDHCWIDVLRMFSLEPHPQDERLREDNAIHQPNRIDWVIQSWNENHPDKQYPFPRGVVDGPFPGQPGYEMPKRLFKYKYCMGGTGSCGRWVHLKSCQSCKHRYYCSEICQKSDWGCGRQQDDHLKRQSMPTKFSKRPLNRLAKPSCWRSHHHPYCRLMKYYKQWVEHQKHTRKGGGKAAAEAEENEENGEGAALKS